MSHQGEGCPPGLSPEECQECRAAQLQELAALRARVRQLEASLALPGEMRGLQPPDDLDLATWGLVAEHAHDFVSLHAPNGGYAYVSPAVESVLGWAPEELLGRDAYQFFHPDDLAMLAAHHAGMDGGAPVRAEYRMRHKADRWVWVETVARPVLDDGEIQHIVCITRDIEERRRADRRLRESNRRLQEFASIAAHDLKAPLQSISAFAELVLGGEGSSCLPPQERRMLGRVVVHAERMAQLVDDLLVWSRMESEEQPIVPTDLNAVADQVIDALAVAIEDRRAQVDVDALPVVPGNPNLLQVLIQNLVVNAIKFTPAERAPRIRIRAERRDRAWALSVRDNGRGMSEDEQRGIFDMFGRASSAEGIPGHGIGLALCARIAALHGGGIAVDSEPGEGSVFTVELPDDSDAR